MASKSYQAELNHESQKYLYLKPNQVLPSTLKISRESKIEDDGSYIPLPRTLYEANMMYMKNINHPAMNMIGSSLKAHRSCNEAIIYLYGVSGAGKSSTLNHLFNNRENVIPVSGEMSCTSEVCEYACTMESDHWKVSNLQIGFIDTPGWDDSRSKDMDAFNFALMENFIATHPHLGCKALKLFPNIILIVINAIDNRIVGQNSKVAQMLRALSQLNIVDTERPNVVFILSHASAIPERKYVEEVKVKKRRIKQLAREFLGIKAPVVMIENNAIDNNLKKDGEWTLLRDDTKQPLNLFSAMMKLMGSSSDEVGIEAIRNFFGNRRMEEKIEKRHLVNEVRIDQKYIERCRIKWSDELSKNLILNTKTEVALILEKFIRERKEEIRQECPAAQVDEVGFLNPLLRVLESYNISTLKELQRSYKQIRKQKKCPLNEAENFILVNVLDVNMRLYPEALEVVGRGFEFFCEILTQNLIFQPAHSDKYVFNSILVKRIPIRYNVFLNKKLDVNYGRSTLIRSDCISIANVRKYRDNDVILDTESPQGFYFGVEEYLYTVSLDFNNLTLSSEFCKDVNMLPDTWEQSDSELSAIFQEFFANYGHWIIIKGSAGGFLQGQFKPKNPSMPRKDIKLGIEGYIEQLKNVNKEWHDSEKDFSYGMMKGIDESHLQWLGGSTEGLPNKLGALTSDQYLNWLDSLSDQPIIFEHSLTTVPIYVFVNLVNKQRGELLKNAFKRMHPDSEDLTFSISDLDVSRLSVSTSQKLKSTFYGDDKPAPLKTDSVQIEIECENATTPVDAQQPFDSLVPKIISSRSEESLMTKKVPPKPPRSNLKPKSNNSEPKTTVMQPISTESIKLSAEKQSKKYPLPPPKPIRKPHPNMSLSLFPEKVSFDEQEASSKQRVEAEEFASKTLDEFEGTRPQPGHRQSDIKKNIKSILEKQLSPMTPMTLPPTLRLYSEDLADEDEQKPKPAPRSGKSQTAIRKPRTDDSTIVMLDSNAIIEQNMSVIEEQYVTVCDDKSPPNPAKEAMKATRDGQTELSKRSTSEGCFPGCSTVALKGGKIIPMQELKIGDSVLSVDKKTLKPRYSKVYMWVHLNSIVEGEFMRIHHEGGALSITPRHLLLCRQHGRETGVSQSKDSILQEPAQLMPAEKVRAGDRVYCVRPRAVQDGDVAGGLNVEEFRVISIEQTHSAKGYYCPVTYSSMVVVDGVVCSVWSLPSHSIGDVPYCHELARTLFYPFRMAHRVGLEGICNNKLDLVSGKHRYSILLENFYQKVTSVTKKDEK